MPWDLIDETESTLFKRGEMTGMAKLLVCQLDHRFGPLADSIRRRLASASKDQLEQWAMRFPDARELTDVFGPETLD